MEWSLWPPITTKFTKDDSLDLELFSKNLEFQIEAGIDKSSWREAWESTSTLTNDEKFELVKETLKITKDKIPVILNIAEQSTKEAIRIVKEAENKGVHGFMLLPPMRYTADSFETVEY